MGNVRLGRLSSRSTRAIAVGIATAVMAISIGASPAYALSSWDEIHRTTNEQRQVAGQPSLIRDATLDAAAQEWADEMARLGRMVHSSTDWRSSRLPQGWDTHGENVAYGYSTAGKVMTAWMNSEGHKANIIKSRYTRIGVGYVASGNYWVQIFAGYQSDRVPPISPAGTPFISGITKVGQTLTASAGSWDSGTSFVFQWMANGVAIAGATGPNISLSSFMVGSNISVSVTGTKPGFRSVTRLSAASSEVGTNLSVSRIDGADRFTVATSISQTTFQDGAQTVYVANGLKYPDALSAGPAAIAEGAPLLLVEPNTMSSQVEAEIRRLSPNRIVIVGGESSVSDELAERLSGLAGAVDRIGGDDRFAVSRSMAQYAFGSTGASKAYVSNGNNFPDALSAGSSAGHAEVPVILVNGSAPTADGETLSQIDALGASSVKIAGGTASVSAGIESGLRSAGNTVTRLAGVDRYAASVAINAETYSSSSVAYVATGLNFPDALAGSVLAGSRDAPLFVIPTSCVPRGVIAEFGRMGVRSVVILGGGASVDPDAAAMTPCSW
jgi:putative cell wall-binding protein